MTGQVGDGLEVLFPVRLGLARAVWIVGADVESLPVRFSASAGGGNGQKDRRFHG
jgi:hypothetical protein